MLPVALSGSPNKLGDASAGHQSYDIVDIKAPEVCFIWTLLEFSLFCPGVR